MLQSRTNDLQAAQIAQMGHSPGGGDTFNCFITSIESSGAGSDDSIDCFESRFDSKSGIASSDHADVCGISITTQESGSAGSNDTVIRVVSIVT